MNINSSSISMAALLSGDSGPAAINPQSAANDAPADPAGSLFRQMIFRMLAARTSAAVSHGRAGGGEGQDISGEPAEMLSGMLTAEGNLAMARLLNTEILTEQPMVLNGQAVKDQSEEGLSAVENAETAELIQALAAGLANGAPVSDLVKAPAEADGRYPSKVSVSAAAPVNLNTVAPEILTSLEQITDNGAQNNSLDAAAALTDGKTKPQVQESGRPASAVSGAIPQAAEAIHGKEGSIGSRDPVSGEMSLNANAAPAVGKAEKQQAVPGLNVRPYEAGTGEQGITAGTSVQPETNESATQPKQKAEPAGISPESAEVSNPNQGTGAPGEAAAQNLLTRSVEKAEPYSQISGEILAKLEQKGPSEFKMQLEPEDLGQIDIKLKLSEGKLVIDILAANSKTHALLASQVDKLISSMGLQNVQVESVQVSHQMNSQSQDSQSQNSFLNAAMDFSQRRQQEQSRGDLNKGADLNGTFGFQQNETQEGNPADRVEAFRYGSYRMDYTV